MGGAQAGLTLIAGGASAGSHRPIPSKRTRPRACRRADRRPGQCDRPRDHPLLLAVRQRGASVLLATHDQRVAEQCDRILHIRDGYLPGDARQSGVRVHRQTDLVAPGHPGNASTALHRRTLTIIPQLRVGWTRISDPPVDAFSRLPSPRQLRSPGRQPSFRTAVIADVHGHLKGRMHGSFRFLVTFAFWITLP